MAMEDEKTQGLELSGRGFSVQQLFETISNGHFSYHRSAPPERVDLLARRAAIGVDLWTGQPRKK